MEAADIKDRIASVEEVLIGPEWEEFEAEAAREKDKVLIALRAGLVKREKYDAEQAELARLRREAEERAEQDRIRAAQEAAVEAECQRMAQQQQAEREAAARREQELLDHPDRRATGRRAQVRRVHAQISSTALH